MAVKPGDLKNVTDALEKASTVSDEARKRMEKAQKAATKEAEEIEIERGRRVVQKAVKF